METTHQEKMKSCILQLIKQFSNHNLSHRYDGTKTPLIKS